MSWIDNIFKKRGKISQQKIVLDNQAIAQLSNGFGITTNQEVRDRRYVEQGYQKNPTVQSIINTTQKNASMVPWKVYRKDASGKKIEIDNKLLNELMLRPNTAMNWHELVNELIGFYMLQGDMYLWGLEGGGVNAGKYTVLRPLPSQHVQIKISENGIGGIEGYALDYSRNRNKTKRGKDNIVAEIEAKDMLHIKNWNPEYDEDATFFYGQSPLRAVRRSLEINNQAIDTGLAYLRNQGLRGLLTLKDAEAAGYSEDQIDQLKSNFASKSKGASNANDIGFSNLNLDFINLMTKAGDLLLVEQYKQSAMDICGVFGFPSSLLGHGKDTYQNMNESKKQLWNDVIIPILSKLRDGLNVWLMPQFGEGLFLDFDLSGIHAIQEDILTRGKAIKEFSGYITVNEARKMSGLAPVETIGDVAGDDMYFFRQGVVRDDQELSNENNDPEKDKPKEKE